MKPLKRKPVNKRRSARSFRHGVSQTHPLNVQPIPMRGGFRI